MGRDEALASLRSPSPTKRAEGAAWFLRHPDEVPAKELMRALQAESVPRVRRLLNLILESRGAVDRPSPIGAAAATTSVPAHPAPTLVPGSTDVAALIRHELSPAVGWIRLAADSEIDEFARSKTNAAVRKLQRRIDGLVALLKESEEPNVTRLGLLDLLIDSWPSPTDRPSIKSPAGGEDVEIETDESLFCLLLSNVYQNASDASMEAVDAIQVDVTFGFTEQNYWLCVTNPFVGDRLDLADVLAVGHSSKASHQGQGLALVSRLADRLAVAVNLQGRSGIATFALSGRRPSA